MARVGGWPPHMARKLPLPRLPLLPFPAAVSQEAASERQQLLLQGYTYDPETGRALRHGPALAQVGGGP